MRKAELSRGAQCNVQDRLKENYVWDGEKAFEVRVDILLRMRRRTGCQWKELFIPTILVYESLIIAVAPRMELWASTYVQARAMKSVEYKEGKGV